MEDKLDFGDTKDFVAKKLSAKDSLSTKFRTLQVFKSVLAFHLDDKDPKALIDLDLQRLEYAKKALMKGTDIADVAFQVGFFDQSHLNKAFKQAYLVTPNRFQRRLL